MTRCNCPRIDGYVIPSKFCPHHEAFRARQGAEPAPSPEPIRDPEADDLACAWSDYRKDYGVTDTATAYKAFTAGWKAAREGDQSGPLR